MKVNVLFLALMLIMLAVGIGLGYARLGYAHVRVEQGSSEEPATCIVFQDSDGVVYYRKSSGDVITDGDTIADEIQQALDYVSSAGGGKVFIRRGVYLIYSTLRIYSYTTVEGEGWGTVLKRPDNTNYTAYPEITVYYPMVVIDNAQNVLVRNLRIDGNAGRNTYQSTDGGNIGILIDESHYCRVENLMVSETWGDGINIRDSEDVHVVGCYIHNTRYVVTPFKAMAIGGSIFVYVERTFADGYDGALELYIPPGKVYDNSYLSFRECTFIKNYDPTNPPISTQNVSVFVYEIHESLFEECQFLDYTNDYPNKFWVGDDALVDEVTFKQCTFRSLDNANAGSSGAVRILGYGITFEDCYFYGGAYNLVIAGGNDIRVVRCRFAGGLNPSNLGQMIAITNSSGTPTSNVVVEGCIFEDSPVMDAKICINYADNVKIIRNHNYGSSELVSVGVHPSSGGPHLVRGPLKFKTFSLIGSAGASDGSTTERELGRMYFGYGAAQYMYIKAIDAHFSTSFQGQATSDYAQIVIQWWNGTGWVDVWSLDIPSGQNHVREEFDPTGTWGGYRLARGEEYRVIVRVCDSADGLSVIPPADGNIVIGLEEDTNVYG